MCQELIECTNVSKYFSKYQKWYDCSKFSIPGQHVANRKQIPVIFLENLFVDMSPNYHSRKLDKKQKRCMAIIQNECNIEPLKDEASKVVAILNAGLSTGLTEEAVLETVEKYGQITRLLMLPNKSYCFMECATIADAENIVSNMNGISPIGQKQAVVYLSYFADMPKAEDSNWLKPMPEGLVLINDFVTEEEECNLVAEIKMDEVEADAALKHRKVKHFGYEFIYGLNNVDPGQPLSNQIPTECDPLWARLQTIAKSAGRDFEWQTPDQLTVNSYEPGQGIPPHVDTHSAFLDPILSLSLESDVVMEFRKGLEKRSVLLPRRSLLIMSGESRYDWTHGITPRVLDVVMTGNGNLTTQRRSKRTSLTFRKLRRAPCNCSFPLLCDTKLHELKTTETTTIVTGKAALLEEVNVHKVYDHIAEHFSETRHSHWPLVADFIKSFPQSSILLDIGCGNGKYLNCKRDLLNIGCDRSRGLLNVCSSLQYQTFRCDCINVPVRSNSVDGCISIAVIHHLATKERRLMAVKEMARILRPTGRGLIYVWAKDQNANNKKSSYLRQNKALNKEKTTEMQQRQQTQQQLEQKAKEAPVSLPVHTNRTEFLQQDVLVPWKIKSQSQNEAEKATFLRYYHVFEEHELEALLKEAPEINVVRSYYDQGNHCVIFEKIKMT